MKEINRYYIERLFPENAETTFVRYLHTAPFQSDKNRRDFLCKTFVRATLAEKELLSDCVELQPHFVEMMLTIAKAVTGHEKLLGGFRGTLSGFLKIFKDKLVDSLSCELLSRFVELISIIPVDIYVDQTFVVNGLIAKILERATENEEVRIDILLKIKQFKESSAKSHLLEQVKMEWFLFMIHGMSSTHKDSAAVERGIWVLRVPLGRWSGMILKNKEIKELKLILIF